ncbi:dTDP-4-amino-4,6-dideoxygalactose transaminase [Desulfomicrobium macestii]|uniref:dTDP-4-amino-4,6-dideoxygalactose transaminase n=1 Tax=Desulfomicrobium macestii TaxID=90731 RepID=A0ABR9H7B5_9BACT|nr:dTDP-4-amino-4,6-dideoxygalactose transaminase [Desulfomicrobium macestii]
MMPFIDLKTQFQRVEEDVRRRMDAVLAHGNFIMGPEVAELEAGLTGFAGVAHCVTCSSGTDALLMALMALGVGPGDAVFTSPFTFIATAEVISLIGATPVFVDIDAGSYTLDPARLEAAIRAVLDRDAAGHPLPPAALEGEGLTPRVVLPVDLYGQPSDYDAINAVADEFNLTVVADAAQSFGAIYKGRRAVAAPQIACTSFFPAKPLGCLGDGGALFTDDDALAEVCRSLRVHGKGDHKYDNVRTGLNARLDTLQAAALLPKLAIFPDELDRRQAVAEIYSARLGALGTLTLPVMPEATTSAWAQYTLRSPLREAIQESLKGDGVPSVVYYPCPLHLQKAYVSLGLGTGSFPAAEAAAGEVFSIPMHPYLSKSDIDMICGCIEKAASR